MASPDGPMALVPSPFTSSLLATTIIFVLLATAAVALRIIVGRHTTGQALLSSDHWTIIASLVFCYGFMIQTIVGSAVVGINHLNNNISPEAAGQFSFKIYFTDLLLTVPASALCKISILEFYKRIFVTPSSRLACNIMILLISAWCIGTFFSAIFSTSPISSAWHPELQVQDANYDYPTFALAVFGIDIVLDFLVLCMPVPVIYYLQVTWQKKMKIYAIFWLGIFCVICASIRLYYAHRQLYDVFEATADEKAFITSNTALWSRLEPSASIIAACLPTYGPLLRNSSLGSILLSLSRFFSLNSRSRDTLTPKEQSDSELYKGASTTRLNKHNWHELHPRASDHETNIEASSAKSLDKPDSRIRATSEFTLTMQEEV